MRRYGKKINNQIVMPVQRFIHHEKSGGIVLAVSVALALILANSPIAEHYFSFFEQKIGITVNGTAYFNFSIAHWINDGLMAIFFFVIGLELKREFISGELSDKRKALLPIGAAIGGMLVPAGIYLLLNPSSPESAGWGIPMATDIAFALGVLYLLGDKVPMPMKVFLTALAVVDDLGAVLVIAFFYTSDISVVSLSVGLGFVLVMYVANRLGVKNVLFYAIIGIGGIWLAFMMSGVHATIAAVLAAFAIPASPHIHESSYMARVNKLMRRFKEIRPNGVPTLENEQVHILTRIKDDTISAIPPLQRLEHSLHPFVAFIVMPVFALANAGISFADMSLSVLLSTNIAAGVALGLLLGKVTGIVGVSTLLIRLKIATPPAGTTLRQFIGIGMLASIGFTMSMFIMTLAFADPSHIVQAKTGIFAASIIGGVSGYLILNKK